MFEHLDDPNPPDFGATALSRVERHCQKRQRRMRVGAISAVTVPSLALGGLLLSRATADAPERVVTSQPDATANSTTLPVTTTANTTTTATQTSALTTTTTTEPEFPLLGDRDTTLGPDEWLLPSDLPEGYKQRGGSVTTRGGIGPDGYPVGDEKYRVMVRSIYLTSPVDENPVVDDAGQVIQSDDVMLEVEIASGPTGMIGSSDGAMPVDDEVLGVPWRVGGAANEYFGMVYLAQRSVGENTVTVTARGEFGDDEFRRAIASLAIVPRDQFDGPIHDPWNPDVLELGSIEAFGDVRSIRLQNFDSAPGAVDLNRRWSCEYAMSGSGYSTRCGGEFLGSDVITGADRHEAHYRQDTNQFEVFAYGLTRTDVDRVELIMFNGDLIDVVPQPIRTESGYRVWLLADLFDVRVSLDSGGPIPVTLPPTIQSVTAYDAAGNVLAVEVAGDWRDED